MRFDVSNRIVNRWLRYYADKYCLNDISDLRGFDYSILAQKNGVAKSVTPFSFVFI